MKQFSFCVLLAVLLFLPDTLHAQRAPSRLAVGLHGNTGTPPLLGVTVPLSPRTALRVSAGFYPETGRYDVATATSPPESVTYTTNWYSGAVAGLYYLPSLWRLSPYTGLKAQYVYARSEESPGRTKAADRVDVGGLLGIELRPLSWLGLSGELGLGYRSGFSQNSGVVREVTEFSPRESEFGLIHAGLGLHVRFH